MRLIEVTRHPLGRRLFLVGRRVEHWHAGTAAIFGGAWAIWRDWQDFKNALRRRDA